MATTPAVDGEALLARLHALFAEDPAIDEIGLLFGIEAEDLAVDTAFQLAEHKLGVAFSAGPLVFRAARDRFHALNKRLQDGEIADRAGEAARELLACSRAVVLISADFYTAWNTRKEFVRRGWLGAASEVAFTSLVFSLHPKSIDTWAYRRWLADRLTSQLTPAEWVGFAEAQTQLCAVLAERFPRNYHAWSFRHWIVSWLDDRAQLDRELVAMQAWCEKHLTDHSGWNHRQHTLRCLLKQLDDGFALLASEYEFLSSILATYPTHEALWCHRRFVMESLLAVVPRHEAAGDDEPVQAACESTLRCVQSGQLVGEKQEWLQHQFRSVRASLTTPAAVPACAAQDIGVAWQCGNRFARRYAAWLVQRLLKIHVPEPTGDTLQRLKQAMRASLATDDALLSHLWRAS